MRKLITIAAGAAIILGFAACNKEGVFNPKKKIAEIYNSTERTAVYDPPVFDKETFSRDKYLSEVWTWDKNLLKTIERKQYSPKLGTDGKYTYEPKESIFTHFEYNGKQLSQVKADAWNGKGAGWAYKYTYEKSKITKIEITDDNKLVATVIIEHDGKKISKTTMKYKITTDEEKKFATSPAMQMILPEVVCEQLSAQISKSSVSKGETEEQTIYELIWDGNNIQKITSYDPKASADKNVMTFEYDKKKNPFRNSLTDAIGDGVDAVALSENNITKDTYTYHGSEQPSVTNYVYAYGGDFPTERTTNESYSVDYLSYKKITTTKSTTYYQYK